MKLSLEKGFSLIELLIVIVVLSIFLTILTNLYSGYVEKSKISNDGIVYGKACLSDLLTYCMENPGKSLNYTNFDSCQSRRSLYGEISFHIPEANCSAEGKLPDNFTIEIYSTASEKYYVKCIYTKGGIKCYTESH